MLGFWSAQSCLRRSESQLLNANTQPLYWQSACLHPGSLQRPKSLIKNLLSNKTAIYIQTKDHMKIVIQPLPNHKNSCICTFLMISGKFLSLNFISTLVHERLNSKQTSSGSSMITLTSDIILLAESGVVSAKSLTNSESRSLVYGTERRHALALTS